MVESVPALLVKGDVNEILIRSGEVRGWQEALKALLSLAAIQPTEQKPEPFNKSYPDPADDDQWTDKPQNP